VTALAPGLVILGIRQWFVAAPPPRLEDRAIAYASVSIVYYAVTQPLIAIIKLTALIGPWPTNALEYVVVPALIGFVVGIATIKDLPDRFWSLFNITLVHHAPTAWDYAFTRLRTPPFVLVTLADNSKVGGYYDKGSFAASLSGERDLLINELWMTPEDDHWTQVTPVRSILLCGRDIRFVEFFKEPNHGK
jgi:hypothetical protein